MEGRRVDGALHVAVHVLRHDVGGDGLLRRGEGDVAGDFAPRPVLHDEQRLAAAPARKGAHGVRLGRVEPDEAVAPVDRRQRGMFAPLEEFDGISLVEWTKDNKIKSLKEFGCNLNNYNPYEHSDLPEFRDERASWF